MTGHLGIQLRETTSADSNFVFEVRRQAFREYVDLEGGWDDGDELDQHRQRFGRQRFLVIVADGTDVGYMATAAYHEATDRYPASLYLHQLMVLPPFQSRRIGSACLRLLADEAEALGLPLRLRVFRVNPRALAFYTAAGFQVVGESDTHISLKLAGVDEWRRTRTANRHDDADRHEAGSA